MSPFTPLLLFGIFFVPPTSSQSTANPLVENEYKDETCLNTTLPKRWRYGKWYDDLLTTKLYKRETRFPSYVGYPCNVQLYNDFYDRFQSKLLTCPFTKGLEDQFEAYKWRLYNNTGNDTVKGYPNPPRPVNFTDNLVFQYVCFSRQWERCEPIPGFNPTKTNGSCNGICECMDQIPVALNKYPNKDPIKYPKWNVEKANHPPNQTLQFGVRCGVLAGGICWSQWDDGCNSTTGVTDGDIEKDYRPKDFYFQCESNAGCHAIERVCECAIGHTCVGVNSVGMMNSLGFWAFGGIYLFATVIMIILFLF